jgi:penicillin-binding protein 2A
MLQGVVESGSGKAAAIEGRDVAGKTGTTQMPGVSGYGAMDNWFVGYTPQLVGAVWLGYDKPDAGHYLTTSSYAAAAVFKELMSSALQGQPNIPFPVVKGMNIGKDHGKEKDKNKGNKDNNRKKEREKEREKDKEREERQHKKDRGKDKDDDNDDGNNDGNDD